MGPAYFVFYCLKRIGQEKIGDCVSKRGIAAPSPINLEGCITSVEWNS